jgi:hypothetical protein
VSIHSGWKGGGWKAKRKAFGLALGQRPKRREKKSKDPQKADSSCFLALFLTSTFPVARLSSRVNGTLLSAYAYDLYGNLTSLVVSFS